MGREKERKEIMVKIALCLSGQPRGLPISFEQLKKNIIEPNGIADVFLHAWHNEADVGKPYNSTQANQNGRVGLVKPKTTEMLLHFYKPKDFIVEPQRDFTEKAESLRSHPTANQVVLASQFYSTYMADQLRQASGIEYDIVLRTRFDLIYPKPIILTDYLEEIKAGKIVVMKKFQEDQERKADEDMPMTDIFAFGNNEVMGTFSSVYTHMERLNALVGNPFSENYHGRLVRVESGIQLHKGDFDLNLLQRTMQLS